MSAALAQLPVVSCESCVYFNAPHQTAADGTKQHVMGQCRFHPPQIVLTDKGHRAMWPLVHPRDWCGQHATREAVVAALGLAAE